MEQALKEDGEFLKGLVDWMGREIGVTAHFADMPDDWTLVVKLHAMIETGLNGVLAREIARPELSPILAKLPTSDTRTGKVAFAKALNIIPPSCATFIQKLSELRNHCVHDVRNFQFDLKKYIADLEEGDRKAFLKEVKKQIAEEHAITNAAVDRDAILRDAPRGALVIGTINVMLYLHNRDLLCELRENKAKLQRIQAENYVRMQESTPKES